MQFIRELERKKLKGDNIDMDIGQFQQWKAKILESEQMRIQSLQLLRSQNRMDKDHILNNQLQTRNIMQKLYDIALNQPDIWRDIKRKEVGFIQDESLDLREYEDREVQRIIKQDQPQQYQDVANYMRQSSQYSDIK